MFPVLWFSDDNDDDDVVVDVAFPGDGDDNASGSVTHNLLNFVSHHYF